MVGSCQVSFGSNSVLWVRWLGVLERIAKRVPPGSDPELHVNPSREPFEAALCRPRGAFRVPGSNTPEATYQLRDSRRGVERPVTTPTTAPIAAPVTSKMPTPPGP